MSNYLPPAPNGALPGSVFWNQWYEQIRTLINNGIVSVTWNNINFTGSNITDIVNRSHNNLQSLQGGTAGQYYHLTSAQQAAVAAGITAVIATAKLTVGGVNGSMTFTNGILTAQTAAT